MRRFFFGLAVFALAAPMPLLAETTDRQIAQQIVRQLKSQKESGELKGFNLDLEVVDGAVYLKGFVSEREQRRNAVEVARRVEGVKQVFNEIVVKNADTLAANPIEKTPLSRQPKVSLASTKLEKPPAPPRVTVEPSEEDEPASATTQSGGQADDVNGLSQAIATEAEPTQLEPTEAVVNEAVATQVPINVFRTPEAVKPVRPIQLDRDLAIETHNAAPAPSARQITEAIVGQYRDSMARGELKGFGIQVQVDQGVVSLLGTVADPDQLEYAIEVARHTQGVKKVVNALQITPTANPVAITPDAEPRAATPAADAVECADNHEAILASHDGSDEGVQHAFRQGSNARPSNGDAERIAKEVVAGLQQQKQEGLLANFGIDVQVDRRVVWLSGYVKDAEQHARALDVARYVPGVEMVVNDLKIQSQEATLRPVAVTPQVLPLQTGPGQAMPNYQLVPIQYMPVQTMQATNQTPMAFAPARPVNHTMMQPGQPVPMTGNAGVGIAPARFDQPQMPGYAWPSYAPHPNYGAVTYPKQYSPSAWPYIGPFYPYPQVPLGWRRVTLEWDDGWWNLKFKNTRMH